MAGLDRWPYAWRLVGVLRRGLINTNHNRGGWAMWPMMFVPSMEWQPYGPREAIADEIVEESVMAMPYIQWVEGPVRVGRL